MLSFKNIAAKSGMCKLAASQSFLLCMLHAGIVYMALRARCYLQGTPPFPERVATLSGTRKIHDASIWACGSESSNHTETLIGVFPITRHVIVSNHFSPANISV